MITDGPANHTRPFAAAAVSDFAYKRSFESAMAMFCTAFDVATTPSLLVAVRENFREQLKRSS